MSIVRLFVYQNGCTDNFSFVLKPQYIKTNYYQSKNIPVKKHFSKLTQFFFHFSFLKTLELKLFYTSLLNYQKKYFYGIKQVLNKFQQTNLT